MPSSSAHPFPDPVVAWAGGADRPDLPLVVLLHGRGADERSILGLADHLPGPSAASYAAVRAPIGEGGGYAWFANRGIGRPLPESLAATTAWFRSWLDEVAPQGRPVVLVGFSGGAAFAGGVLLDDPARLAGTAVLHGTLPFEDAGVDVSAGRLAGSSVFLTHGDADAVIPLELQARTWSWLHDESGATLTSRRDPGGHALSAETVAELSEWLAARVRTEA
ncbi:serine esterase [Nocardioides sp. Root122]|uniref:alpha/beta hydrolase n=1 Tax=Nocardioides TaxID=1839 RepID=UPI00070376B2|nr:MULTISPECIES: serine esterase [Nocardioides]KQV77396.1 serine esterase [Nocardioides sp. Root122]MCK9824573.1 serine esterase [Nocardioides cavernae]